MDTVSGAESWVALLSSEPRMKNVTAIGEDWLAVTVDECHGRTLRTAIVLYRRLDGEWVASRVIPSASSAIAVGGDSLVYLRSAAGVQLVCLEDVAGGQEPVRLAGFQGRIGALVWRSDDRSLLFAAQSTADEPTVGFRPAEATHTAEANISLADARSGAGPWRLYSLRLGGELSALPLAVPDGCALTGESAWLDRGRIVCGLMRSLPDGRQRYGLAVWHGDGGEPEQVWLSGHDLTAPVSSPGGRTLAVLASTIPTRSAHLDHRPYLLDGADLTLLEIPNDPEFWDLPRCWLSDTRLVLLSERHSRRVVLLHDIVCASTRTVPARRSVLAVAPLGTDSLATIESSPASPPLLQVQQVSSGAGNHPVVIERTGPTPSPSDDLGWTTVSIGELDTAYRLFLPAGGLRPRGLVAMFHGGPTMSWSDWSWRWNPEPMCQLGFAVALLEPPMSSGYGSRSQAMGWRSWGTGIASHAARMVDAVRDRHRLGSAPLITMGGSFGGYLALQLAAQRDVDLVASHAAPVDLAEVAYSSDAYWSWVREYGHPLDGGRNYRAQSVDLTAIPTTTRVLLSHGMHDDLVPCNESVRAHRILLRRGVASELTLFRGEGHALRNPITAADWFRWVLRGCTELPDHPLSATG